MGFSISSVKERSKRIKEALEDESRRLSFKEGQLDMLTKSAATLKQEVVDLEQKVMDYKLIEAYLANFSDERQAKVYRQLEATVTEGLKAIFDEDIRLEVETKLVGSRSEVVFTLVSMTEEGELRTGIMDSRGGGVAAVVGFMIQSVLILLTPGIRKIIFLDETFRNVSSQYQGALGQWISDLCKRTGLQLVLVTHQPEIAEFADTHYSFSQRGGKTQIEREH